MINEGKKGFKVRHKRKVASIEPTKPRNFVAKNAINTGAGAHKDKKKAMKQGDTKHKKSYAEGMEEKFQAQLNELNQKTKDSYKDKAEKQVKELEPHAKKGEYKDIAKRAIDRRKKGLARVAEGKVKLYTDPDYFGAEVDDAGFDSLPVVNISADRLVGFEPDSKMNQTKSQANVEKIVAGLKKGNKLPPLLVRKYKDGYQVLDGHHRFWAYKLLGTKNIPVRIVADKDIEEISKQGVAEGSTTRGGFSGSASQAQHEIQWLKNKIETLKPLLAKKPSVARQIKDLERQIRERELSISYQKEGVAEGSDYTPPKLGTVKANLMNTQKPTVQVQVFKHNTLRGDSYWVTKEVKTFKTMDQAQAHVDRINKQGVAEGTNGWVVYNIRGRIIKNFADEAEARQYAKQYGFYVKPQGVAEGWKGGAIGGAVSALAGPEAIPVGMAVGDKVGDWVGGKDMDEGTDTEGGMAKQQLITAAKLAIKLAERMEADTQLDAWVQTKISLASDYIETVFDFIVNGEQDVDKEVETDEEVVPGITHQHRHGTMKSTSTAMEGAKVDRQAKHITKSMMKAHPGMSKSDAEGAAWAHIKHPKKKKKVKEDAYDIYLEVMLGKSLKK
jgi:hypothetical protein